MMTEKYAAYIQMLAMRDLALANLGAAAMGIVIAWEVIKLWPDPWCARVRQVYLVGGMLLYVATLLFVAMIGVSNG